MTKAFMKTNTVQRYAGNKGDDHPIDNLVNTEGAQGSGPMNTSGPASSDGSSRAQSSSAWLLCCVILGLVSSSCISRRSDFMIPPIRDSSAHRSPSNLYEEVVLSIHDAEAYLVAGLREGTIELEGGAKLLIDKPIQAGITLKIHSGTVSSASVEFSRRLVIRPDPKLRLWLSFRHLQVAENGEVDPTDLRFEGIPDRLMFSSQLGKIRQLFAQRVRLNMDVLQLMAEGKVFASNDASTSDTVGSLPNFKMTRTLFAKAFKRTLVADTARSGTYEVSSSKQSLGDFVTNVTIRVSQASLRPGSVFLFTDYDKPAFLGRTRVVVGQDSTFAIPFASLNPITKTVSATIDLGITTLESAIFTADQRFEFASGSKLIATHLRFERSPTGWSFGSSNGYAQLAFKAGMAQLEGSSLEIGPRSIAAVYAFSMAATNNSQLALGGAGKLALKIDSGSFHFNTLPNARQKRNQITLGPGSEAVVEGELLLVNDGGRPAWRVRNGQARLDLNVKDGLFDLGSGGVVLAGMGSKVRAGKVNFDTSEVRNISGRLDLIQMSNVKGRIPGQLLQSRLNLDPDSFILLGDGSEIALRDCELVRGKPDIKGRMSADLKAVGGVLKIKSSSFDLSETGNRVVASDAELDTSSRNIVSGHIESLACVLDAAHLDFGKAGDVTLAGNSSATFSDVQVNKESGRFTGNLRVSAKAIAGSYGFGPGDSRFPIQADSMIEAPGLHVDTSEANAIHGLLTRSVVRTRAAILDLSSPSHKGTEGISLVRLDGKAEFTDVLIPAFGNKAHGAVVLDVSFAGGHWDFGAAFIGLQEGQLRSSIDWWQDGGITKYHMKRPELGAKLRAFVNAKKITLSELPGNVTGVPHELEMDMDGGIEHLNITFSGNEVMGQLAQPFVEKASGRLSFALLSPILFDFSVRGVISIPCDGDAGPGGAKSYVTELKCRLSAGKDNEFAGNFAFDSSAQHAASLALSEVGQGAIHAELLNLAEKQTTLADVRSWEGDDLLDPGCARVTFRWHPAHKILLQMHSPALELSSGCISITGVLVPVAPLEIKKHSPSKDGLSWDGSDAVEDLDILSKIIKGTGLSAEMNKAMNGLLFEKMNESLSKSCFNLPFTE